MDATGQTWGVGRPQDAAAMGADESKVRDWRMMKFAVGQIGLALCLSCALARVDYVQLNLAEP